MKYFLTLALLSLSVGFSQVTTSLLDGMVADPSGSAVVGAEITVTNVDNGQVLKVLTDERGRWALASMIAGDYRVSASIKGFRTSTIDSVKLDAGVPKTVNLKLEVGAVTETVEVQSGGELVQATSATITSTVQQRQVQDLPFISRGGMDLLVTQPGVQTGNTNRGSFINGLPLAALSVTMDGINTQDNYYKNGDGFFTLIPARQDALEEITLSTSATGVDANAQGAATVKFITKGGTNVLHGGAFWQHRNTALDANSYFNNINGLQRNKVILNQGGFNLGGPIKKNKLFFFTNYEIYRYPAADDDHPRSNAAGRDSRELYLSSLGRNGDSQRAYTGRRRRLHFQRGPDHRPDAGPDQWVHEERHAAGSPREQFRLRSQQLALPAKGHLKELGGHHTRGLQHHPDMRCNSCIHIQRTHRHPTSRTAWCRSIPAQER